MPESKRSWPNYRSAISVVIFLIVLWTAGAMFAGACFGISDALPQIFAVVILGLLGGTAAAVIFIEPSYLAHPTTVLICGCIYFFLLDAAVQREVAAFSPQVLLEAEAALSAFILAALSVWCVVKVQRSPFERFFGKSGVALSGRQFFWGAVIFFSLEAFRRLYFVQFNWSEFVREMMLARSGGSFRRLSYEGDWKVFLQPAEELFLLVPFLADRALADGRISFTEKGIVAALAIAQLLTSVLDGNRGVLLESLALPVFARATRHDVSMRKWLIPLVLVSLLLVPTMDLMEQVRSKGWAAYSGDEQVSWNPLDSHRDDNFYWTVVTVDYARHHGGIWSYKGPAGFINGLLEESFLWVTSPIPRVVWPNKPTVYDIADLTKPTWITEGIVGELFRTGGVMLVVFGGVIVGLWISCLEPLFFRPHKDDVSTLEYALLMLVTLSLLRDPTPWVTVPIFLTAVAVALGSRLFSPRPCQAPVWMFRQEIHERHAPCGRR